MIFLKKSKEMENIYILAAIESIINNNTSTDLGELSLEFKVKVVNLPDLMLEDTYNIAMEVMVRSRENATGKLKDADIFHKKLKRGYGCEEEREMILNQVFNMSTAEKMDLIMRREKKLSSSKYRRNWLYSPDEFFEGIDLHNDGLDDHVLLGIELPDSDKECLQSKVDEYLKDFRESLIQQDKKEPKNN